MDNTLDRLKVLLDSSTPIVVVETVEESRATRLVRVACSTLNIAAFEWSIATGLTRCGTNVADSVVNGAFPPGGYAAGDTHAIEENVSLGDNVLWMSHNGRSQGALARPVRTHDGVYLALFDLEVYSLENLLAFDGGVEVFDVELARCGSLLSGF